MVDQVCSLQAHVVCAAILSGNTGVSKALLATERDIAQGKLRILFTAPGAIVGNSRWKQILLELSDSGSHCVYKILMRPHTLSAHSLHERLHHCRTKVNNQHSLMSEYSIPWQPQIVHPPLTHATEDTNARRGEHTNSVSMRWSMVPLLLWFCPQVEVGVLLPRWPSRDSQVSSLRNTANRTAAPSTSSNVRSP